MSILYISSHEAKTENGFLSKNFGKIIEKNAQIENIPDFTALNQPNELSDKHKGYENIDTIIQYLPLDDCEYIGPYKNIIVYTPQHFITKNKSIADKLAIFDEVWLLDENSKTFLDGCNLENKIRVVGYPYIPGEITEFINISQRDDIVTYYTIIGDYQLENIESLISNFIVTFSRVRDAKLIVYINTNPVNHERLQQEVDELMSNIKKYLKLTSHSLIDSNITIMLGDIWSDDEIFVKINDVGDCYINMDYKINPYILIASTLKKYCLSICDFKKLLYFTKNCTIQTYKTTFRKTLNDINYKHVFNEYNLFPKILDESIKSVLISSYNNMKTNIDNSVCFDNFSIEGYFSDQGI